MYQIILYSMLWCKPGFDANWRRFSYQFTDTGLHRLILATEHAWQWCTVSSIALFFFNLMHYLFGLDFGLILIPLSNCQTKLEFVSFIILSLFCYTINIFRFTFRLSMHLYYNVYSSVPWKSNTQQRFSVCTEDAFNLLSTCFQLTVLLKIRQFRLWIVYKTVTSFHCI